jgi:ankyrin repeat protein
MQFLIDHGADINSVDNNGETAMHGAAYKNAPRVVEFLASHGARIDIWNRQNKYGWTPLVIAEGHRVGNFKPSPETIGAIKRVIRSTSPGS